MQKLCFHQLLEDQITSNNVHRSRRTRVSRMRYQPPLEVESTTSQHGLTLLHFSTSAVIRSQPEIPCRRCRIAALSSVAIDLTRL